ncbi:MAG: hypothetical protein Q9195_009268 [Heterodermia aff. obscurata]
MEVDLTATGLQKVPESLGIESVPEETRSITAPQTKTAEEKFPSRNHSSRKSRRYLPFIIAAIIVVVVVLALAIPLALELKKHSETSPIKTNSTTGVPNDSPASGAFNGTALAIVALDQTHIPDVSLFYQDNKSRIRRLHSIELSPFFGGFPVVTANARNATPLTALTYPTTTGELNSHLYYIDNNNTLQELYSIDNCTTWLIGSLGDYKFEASASSTALTAFYSDKWLGQDGNSSGIRLYYGAPDNHVHELALFPTSPDSPSQYFSHFVFPNSNGNAGLTSIWSEESGLGNLYMYDQNDEFQIWSNKFNTSQNDTAATGNWVTDGGQNYYSIKTNTALSSPSGILCFQERSDGLICASLNPDGSLQGPSTSHPVANAQSPRQGGSALVAWWQATPGTFPSELVLFYQIENGEIIQDIDATGTWVNSTVPAR